MKIWAMGIKKRPLIPILILVGIGCLTVVEAGNSEIKRPDKTSSAAEWEAWRARRRAAYRLLKPTGPDDEKIGTHDGNLIRTIFFNFGSIGAPHREPSIEWPQGSEQGYGYEFGPIVAAEVTDATGTTRHIVTEGLDDGGDTSPQGYRWGWEPLAGYAADQPSVAMSDRPETWPPSWPLSGDRWPGEFGYGVIVADQESYYKMDDYYNKEFTYYPDLTDSSRGGIGLEVEVRGYQWAHILAEDCIFFTYEIKNVCTTDYERVIFGMYGDPHPGGENDYNDDDGYYDTRLDMVFAWDHDNEGDWGPGVGYFGYKFLESPGNPYDGVDNDEDDIIDERMDDGIDNDGDWNAATDDVGADGMGPTHPDYPGPDEGEGDGVPTHGEPNFDETDLDEADQIGLTGFDVALYHSYYPYDDETMWQRMLPGEIDSTGWAQTADNVFLYSSGFIELHVGDIQRFSIALLCGEDEGDLRRNANTVQTIYNAQYHFVKPPLKPHLTAVSGDRKVTLYWDNRAEYSYDDVYGYDFEGYAIYRATDFRFNEVRNITDSEGHLTGYTPIAKFDLVNRWEGPHPEGINGFHYYMGDNTGLVHSWTDTTVYNGQTYYYAVVAYDTGAVAVGATPGIAPAECTKRISEDPLHPGTYETDVNTAIVIPRAPAAGFTMPELEGGEVEHISVFGTGTVGVNILDPMLVKNDYEYKLTIDDTSYSSSSDTLKTFTVRCLQDIRETFVASDLWVELDKKHIMSGSVFISDAAGDIVFTDSAFDSSFAINYRIGAVKALDSLAIQLGENYNIVYQYYPVYQSIYFGGEDLNPYFDGLQVIVNDDPLELDTAASKWIEGDCNYKKNVSVYVTGDPYPADYEFRFEGTIGDSVREDARPVVHTHTPFVLWNVTENRENRFVLIDQDQNGYWTSDDKVVILTDTVGYVSCYEVTLTAPDSIIVTIDSTDIVTIDSVGIDTLSSNGDTSYVTLYDTTYGSDTTYVTINRPEPGDVFSVRTFKPFTSQDVFYFKTEGATEDKRKAKELLDRVAVVPNPYVATEKWEPKTSFISGRGERRVYFIHLPAKCTIRIYTITGELVKKIEHQSAIDDGQHGWDLLNRDNMEIAFGIYIFHVDAPGIGETIGKFAVIK